jgi:hypothetical protein
MGEGNAPVRVIQNDDVGARQIDSEPTGSSGQQEYELVAVGSVIIINRDDPLIMRRAPINPTILYPKLSMMEGRELGRRTRTVLPKQAIVL